MSNGETQLAATSLGQIKQYLGNDTIKQRFQDMLGKRSSAFTNSLINVVRNSKQLQSCTPESIMSAAIIPATLNLSIEPTLGQSYIIAYKSTAVFQIGYKGVLQLCIRSGQYKVIHCSEIYADELKSYNPITGKVEFHDPANFKMRYADKEDGKNVIGHYAYFKLNSGFEKAEYMTKAEVMAHAKKYSQAYQYDLRQGKKSSPWSTDPIPMGNKTVLLKLLKRFGIMSVEMKDAIVKDETFEAASEAAAKQIESEQGGEEIVTDFEPDKKPAEENLTPQQKAARTRAANKARKEAEAAAKEKAVVESGYVCKGCCEEFDTPKMGGKAPNQVDICPKCLSSNIRLRAEATQRSQPDFMNNE